MSKLAIKLGLVSTVVFAQLFFVSTVVANSGLGSTGLSFIPDAGGDLLTWLKSTLNLLIGLSALIAVAVLVYSGIQYIVASGDETKIEKATKGITYAIVGLVICFVSVMIVNFVLTKVLV